MKIGSERLNFLDVILINNNTIKFDWYHKSTFSGRYLNFLSHYPPTQKRGTLMSMIEHFYYHIQDTILEKNLIFIINTFLLNNYPLNFIFNTIKYN